mmetsp:Transcript_8294/g.37063  ORF Transcript_8294/g.37063 Transcript_8294/m.37063 type:complete len:82 (+) Transcript_8294:1336-1581(+)
MFSEDYTSSLPTTATVSRAHVSMKIVSNAASFLEISPQNCQNIGRNMGRDFRGSKLVTHSAEENTSSFPDLQLPILCQVSL